jgi:hypothetical protein
MSIELGPVFCEPGCLCPEDAITEETLRLAELCPQDIGPIPGEPDPDALVPAGPVQPSTPPAWLTKALVEKREQLAALDVAIADSQGELKRLRKTHKELTEEYRGLLEVLVDHTTPGAGQDATGQDAAGPENTTLDAATTPASEATGPGPTEPSAATTPAAPTVADEPMPPGAVEPTWITLIADKAAASHGNRDEAERLFGRAGETIRAWIDDEGDVFAAMPHPDPDHAGEWLTEILIPWDQATGGDYVPAMDPGQAIADGKPRGGLPTGPAAPWDFGADDPEAWRAVPIDELAAYGLSRGIINILTEPEYGNHIANLGMLANFTAANKPLTALRKIGEAKASAIADASERYWAANPPAATAVR